AVDETHRLGEQIVFVVNASQLTRLRLRWRRHWHHAGEHRGRRGGGELQVGEVSDPGFDRAIDVANEPRGAGNCSNLHRAVEAAGLRRVDRYDLSRSFLDDLYDVVGIPRAFVRHDRSVDRARDLGETINSFHRLLKID